MLTVVRDTSDVSGICGRTTPLHEPFALERYVFKQPLKQTIHTVRGSVICSHQGLWRHDSAVAFDVSSICGRTTPLHEPVALERYVLSKH